MRDIPRPRSKEYVVRFEFDNETEVLDTEEQLIAHYGRLHEGGTLLNRVAGGRGVKDPCPETREKMSSAKTGRKLSIETRQKMSRSAKGRAKTKEHAANVGFAIANNYLVLTPDNQVIVVRGLNRFASKRGLSDVHLRQTVKGERNHHKKYIAFEVPDETEIDMELLRDNGEYELGYTPDFIANHTIQKKVPKNSLSLRLTKEAIEKIRELIQQGEPQKKVGKLFGISQLSAVRIGRGEIFGKI